MNPGQGFVRRVTIETIARFAALLGAAPGADSAQDAASGQPRGEVRPRSPELESAEALFRGTPFPIRVPPLRRSGRPGGGAPGRSRSRTGTGVGQGTAILIAEIPRGGGRWSQANFDAHTFASYFGGTVGASGTPLLLQNVGNPSGPSPVERRQTVSVVSRNFRVELGAGAGRAYPAVGRPIAVFARSDEGLFRYVLLMPGDPGHAAVSSFLDANWSGRTDRMRRLQTELDVLQAAWPGTPF